MKTFKIVPSFTLPLATSVASWEAFVCGGHFNMKLIPLTQGKFTQVDDEDYDYLMQWKWYALKSHQTYYAMRYGKENGKEKRVIMHRVIMKTPEELVVDHKDHDGLNNQKSNLRNCTAINNGKNRIPWINSSSKYLGVFVLESTRISKNGRVRKYNYITSALKIGEKLMRLGVFKTEEDAAFAYNEAAKIHHGEFASLNILPDGFIPSARNKKTRSSKYIGVSFSKKYNKYVAYIWNKRQINIGHYKTEIEAAIAYNKRAIEIFGKEAKLNIIN